MSVPTSGAIHNTRQQLDELDSLLQKMLDLPVSNLPEPGSNAVSPPAPPPTIAPPSLNQSETRYEPSSPPRPSFIPPPNFSSPPPPAPAPEPAADTAWRIELPGDPPPPPPPSVFHAWNDPQWVPGQVTPQTPPVPVTPQNPPVPVTPPVSYQPPPPTPDPVPVPSPSGSLTVEQPSHPSTPVEVAPLPEPNRTPEPVAPLPITRVAEAIPAPPALDLGEDVSSEPAPLEWWALPFLGLDICLSFVLRRLGPPGRFLVSSTGRNLLGYTGVLMFLAALGWGIADWLKVGWSW